MTLRGGRQDFASLPEKLVEGYGPCRLEELSSLYLDRACPIIRGKEQEPKAGSMVPSPSGLGWNACRQRGQMSWASPFRGLSKMEGRRASRITVWGRRL